jgi:uncharacterized membrane protein YedE/YeeE
MAADRLGTRMNTFASFGMPLLGGALVGLSASLALFAHGRAVGISGLFGGLFLPGHDARPFRFWFLAGLVMAGAALRRMHPAAFAAPAASWIAVAIAGVTVGYGTRLGSGCTSGHGICGLCRLSVRSIVATATFIATGMATVFVVKHLLGGAP